MKYEPYVARALQANLGPGGVFLDVGSHFGLWSVYTASIIGKTGKVFAFEPSPAFAVLKENAVLNPRVRYFNMGVGAQDGEVTFFEQGTATSGSFVKEVTVINEEWQPAVPIAEIKVKIRSLDTLITELDIRPDLIKVDVEGFEFEVISGSEKILRSISPVLLIEIHPPQLKLSGGSDLALIAFLESRGYTVEVIDRNPNSIYTILARLTKVNKAAAAGV